MEFKASLWLLQRKIFSKHGRLIYICAPIRQRHQEIYLGDKTMLGIKKQGPAKDFRIEAEKQAMVPCSLLGANMKVSKQILVLFILLVSMSCKTRHSRDDGAIESVSQGQEDSTGLNLTLGSIQGFLKDYDGQGLKVEEGKGIDGIGFKEYALKQPQNGKYVVLRKYEQKPVGEGRFQHEIIYVNNERKFAGKPQEDELNDILVNNNLRPLETKAQNELKNWADANQEKGKPGASGKFGFTEYIIKENSDNSVVLRKYDTRPSQIGSENIYQVMYVGKDGRYINRPLKDQDLESILAEKNIIFSSKAADRSFVERNVPAILTALNTKPSKFGKSGTKDLLKSGTPEQRNGFMAAVLDQSRQGKEVFFRGDSLFVKEENGYLRYSRDKKDTRIEVTLLKENELPKGAIKVMTLNRKGSDYTPNMLPQRKGEQFEFHGNEEQQQVFTKFLRSQGEPFQVELRGALDKYIKLASPQKGYLKCERTPGSKESITVTFFETMETSRLDFRQPWTSL